MFIRYNKPWPPAKESWPREEKGFTHLTNGNTMLLIVYLLVGYFLFLSLNFWKKTLWKSKHWTKWPFQKHQSNQPYVTIGVKIYDKNIIFTALSSYADLSVSVHLQNICIHHQWSQSEIQSVFVTGCPELFHLAGFLNESL